MPNRLIDETSPYLIQHAFNPVDWYPWGKEALERSKNEDKPILVSVGYSACHWCHVMERESFENREIAKVMNENFICIKVDREERPDIDSIYMSAVQAMTGHGGWPMTVFLTPDGIPFYGGTYFPPEDRHGIPSFLKVLHSIAREYRENRNGIANTSQNILQHMQQISPQSQKSEELTKDVITKAYVAISKQFDDRHGGTGIQPKFPQPMTYEFLLRYHLYSKDSQALNMVTLTLEQMAFGGIYDQLGGGFHRYSTDIRWLVPHFEKMLYDNALLAQLYLHAYQATGKPLYKNILQEILDYVVREMTDTTGGFYSSQDADSEGVEGKYFVWRPEEIVKILGKEDGEIINQYFDVTVRGNFEGQNILHLEQDTDQPNQKQSLDGKNLENLIKRSKTKLLAARQKRIKPNRDDKILTAWNGMMMKTFAEAAAVLDRPDYGEIANQNAKFILQNLRDGKRLLRSFKDGQAKLKGYLEDYAFLIDGLIALHELDFDQRWIKEAIFFGEAMVDLFWDESSGQFFDTGIDHEKLILRPHDISDNATPSGSSKATEMILRLAVITGDAEYERRAVTALKSAKELISKFPTGAGHWLCVLDFYLSKTIEIAIVGNRRDQRTHALATAVYQRYLPNRVLVGLNDGGKDPTHLPLLNGRERIHDHPTAYVCQNYACQLPVTEPEALEKRLMG